LPIFNKFKSLEVLEEMENVNINIESLSKLMTSKTIFKKQFTKSNFKKTFNEHIDTPLDIHSI
jgi:hypothetical protein